MKTAPQFFDLWQVASLVGHTIPAWLFLAAPRLLAVACSMLVDVSAARLAPVVGISGRSVHLTLATAWPMLLLHTRPLSNTYESILFALLLVLFLAPPRALSPRGRSAAFGALLTAALFFRFTIVFFALPLVSPISPSALIDRLSSLRKQGDPAPLSRSDSGGRQRSGMSSRESRAGRLQLAPLSAGAAVAGALLVIFDSVFFFGTLRFLPPGWNTPATQCSV